MAEDDDEACMRFMQATKAEHGIDAVGHFLLSEAMQESSGGVA